MNTHAYAAHVPGRPLNPDLHRRLELAFGRVKISKAGTQAIVARAPIVRGGRIVSNFIERGEDYVLICPYCDDDQGKLYVNHLWGQPDPINGEPMRHLACCFKSDCLRTDYGDFERKVLEMEGTAARAAMKAMNVALRPRVATEADLNQPAPSPGEVVPLDALPADHKAVRYLREERGFDPAVLAREWGVGVVTRAVPPYLAAAGRIYAPVRKGRMAIGWQCRWPGDDYKRHDAPKYFTCPGFPTGRNLYGLDEAKGSPCVVLVEGVADAWAYGPGALGLFGKEVSAAKRELLKPFAAAGALCVLALDPEAWTDEVPDDPRAKQAAAEKRKALVADLSARFRGRFFELELPAGKDPGSFPRAELRRLVADQAAAAGFPPADYGLGAPSPRLREKIRRI
jgi:hypothetical protein